MKRNALPHWLTPMCAVSLLWLCANVQPAQAAGYHVLKADVHHGQSSAGSEETGFGFSLYSDEFATSFTYGAPNGDERRLRDAWIGGSWWGPVMGVVPTDFADLEERYDDLSRRRIRGLMPYRFWRVGSNADERRNFSWDWSTHTAFNFPGAFGADHRRLLFGPTVGVGLNLTWWDRWRDSTDRIINTGKVTGEAGWVAGAAWQEVYAQARITSSVDLFGQHQWSTNLAAIAGILLSKVPFGLEFQGELTRGNDTVDMEERTVWKALLALQFRVLPGTVSGSEEDQKFRELMEMLPELEAAMERKQRDEQEAESRREAIEQETRGLNISLDVPTPRPDIAPTLDEPHIPPLPTLEEVAPTDSEELEEAPVETEESDEATEENGHSGPSGPDL